MLKDFSKDEFDIVIQAGQSNSEGTGFGDVENPYVPNDKVWYLNNDFTISRAAELVAVNDIQSNYALSFSREYVDRGLLKGNRKLLILRAGVGGTGFSDGHWNMSGDLYLRMMDMIRASLALNPSNRLVAFLWHQGETDAILGASFEMHYNHLIHLLHSVRETFSVPTLPFITADFVHHWKNRNLAICTPVLDAIRAVCKECNDCVFIETDGLLSNEQQNKRHPWGWDDNIHFSRKSLYDLGERYFAAFASCIAAS